MTKKSLVMTSDFFVMTSDPLVIHLSFTCHFHLSLVTGSRRVVWLKGGGAKSAEKVRISPQKFFRLVKVEHCVL